MCIFGGWSLNVHLYFMFFKPINFYALDPNPTLDPDPPYNVCGSISHSIKIFLLQYLCGIPWVSYTVYKDFSVLVHF